MATYATCGADTELYFRNIPICMRCPDTRERQIEHQNPIAESSERSTQTKK